MNTKSLISVFLTMVLALMMVMPMAALADVVPMEDIVAAPSAALPTEAEEDAEEEVEAEAEDAEAEDEGELVEGDVELVPEATMSPEPLTDATVLATVNGVDVPYSNVKYYYSALVSTFSQMMDVSSADMVMVIKSNALDLAVSEQVLINKAAELGLDQFTDEETMAMETAANNAYQTAVENYLPMFAAEGVTEEQQLESVEAFLAENDYSLEKILRQFRTSEICSRTMASASEGAAVTEEDVRAAFDQAVEQAKATYDADKSQYDTVVLNGGLAYYTPEGVRAVKHVLVKMDQAEVSQLKTYEEELAALPEGDAARTELQQKIDELKQPYQTKLDEVNQKYSEGESFAALIEAYGEDPGMQAGSPYQESGYYVNDQTVVFEMTFTQAAMGLEKVGDISEPVLGSNGYHIVYYDHDVPAGAIAYEEVADTMREEAQSELTDGLQEKALAEWTAAADVVKYLERYTEVSQ